MVDSGPGPPDPELRVKLSLPVSVVDSGLSPPDPELGVKLRLPDFIVTSIRGNHAGVREYISMAGLHRCPRAGTREALVGVRGYTGSAGLC